MCCFIAANIVIFLNKYVVLRNWYTPFYVWCTLEVSSCVLLASDVCAHPTNSDTSCAQKAREIVGFLQNCISDYVRIGLKYFVIYLHASVATVTIYYLKLECHVVQLSVTSTAWPWCCRRVDRQSWDPTVCRIALPVLRAGFVRGEGQRLQPHSAANAVPSWSRFWLVVENWACYIFYISTSIRPCSSIQYEIVIIVVICSVTKTSNFSVTILTKFRTFFIKINFNRSISTDLYIYRAPYFRVIRYRSTLTYDIRSEGRCVFSWNILLDRPHHEIGL